MLLPHPLLLPFVQPLLQLVDAFVEFFELAIDRPGVPSCDSGAADANGSTGARGQHRLDRRPQLLRQFRQCVLGQLPGFVPLPHRDLGRLLALAEDRHAGVIRQLRIAVDARRQHHARVKETQGHGRQLPIAPAHLVDPAQQGFPLAGGRFTAPGPDSSGLARGLTDTVVVFPERSNSIFNSLADDWLTACCKSATLASRLPPAEAAHRCAAGRLAAGLSGATSRTSKPWSDFNSSCERKGSSSGTQCTPIQNSTGPAGCEAGASAAWLFGRLSRCK